MSTRVSFIGGPIDRANAEMTSTPRVVQVRGAWYEAITDPDTSEFLDAYAYTPTPPTTARREDER